MRDLYSLMMRWGSPTALGEVRSRREAQEKGLGIVNDVLGVGNWVALPSIETGTKTCTTSINFSLDLWDFIFVI